MKPVGHTIQSTQLHPRGNQIEKDRKAYLRGLIVAWLGCSATENMEREREIRAGEREVSFEDECPFYTIMAKNNGFMLTNNQSTRPHIFLLLKKIEILLKYQILSQLPFLHSKSISSSLN
jgi:hypothetical protein